MRQDLERVTPVPTVLDTVRVAGALRRSERRVALARIEADEISAEQTAKATCVGDVTDAVIDIGLDLVAHARARGADRDPAKAVLAGEFLDSAKNELRAVISETGRRLRR